MGSLSDLLAVLRLTLDNWRWAGVPFYLRTGKRLQCKLTEVSIQFRPTPHLMFPTGRENAECHLPTFRLQPHEGILQRFVAKEPRPSLTLRPVTMNFACADAFGIEKPPRPCAWLLLEVMEGDQRLFARADWIYEAWSIVDRLVRHWEDRQPRDFPNCAAGTSGPADGDRLLARDGRAWRAV